MRTRKYVLNQQCGHAHTNRQMKPRIVALVVVSTFNISSVAVQSTFPKRILMFGTMISLMLVGRPYNNPAVIAFCVCLYALCVGWLLPSWEEIVTYLLFNGGVRSDPY
ncbi:hypothetical protein POJ06DRAFT_90552 [Lipomyces tetrasporus]|uniref:Uncharacterized protein n=1 Tax=Lipomyces tetrasporus TaxID=54092 RepID=A0AAD7QTS3_9ASCO|nr:uncharacterized protein POJ06DRAFT_90552 [Lipomyces tetrasporus]KAJ8101189.1 hypothetical protein POJ06DRAFT_90552 [Lipomyces tetrasporus]